MSSMGNKAPAMCARVDDCKTDGRREKREEGRKNRWIILCVVYRMEATVSADSVQES